VGNFRGFKRSLVGLLVVAFIFSVATTTAGAAQVMTSKVVTGFKASSIALTTAQKSLISKELKLNTKVHKVTCVGLIYRGRNPAQARLRAKAACDYIGKLKPATIRYVTSTATPQSKESGQVEIQLKWDVDNTKYLQTDSLTFDINTDYTVGKACGGGFGWQVVGLDGNSNPAFLRCSNPNGGVFKVDPNMPKIDPSTRKPLVPETVPSKTLFGYSPNLYIEPLIVDQIPTTTISSGAFDNYGKCKVAEVGDGSVDKSFGFPLPEARLDLKKNFKILVIPVQFTDHRTNSNPEKEMGDVVSALTSFYTRTATIPVSFEWTIPAQYVQTGKSIKSFDLGIEFDPTFKTNFWTNYRAYIQEMIDLVDGEYDFSQFDAVIVEEPRSVTDAEHGMFIPYVPDGFSSNQRLHSDEGPIKGLMVTGNDEQRDIPNWLHEFGHLFGLPDGNPASGSTPGFDLMWGWYGSPELSVWNRWLLGVLEDDQVDCKTDFETSTHWIRPLAWVGDYKKAVAIPVSDHEVIVVESRRRQGYDALFGKESEGAYVYRVDTSALIYRPDTKRPVDVIAPERSLAQNGRWSLDAALDPGESVTSDGWNIKVLEAGLFGDVVEVSRKK
jgi:M6 family metalloprotease-like protein